MIATTTPAATGAPARLSRRLPRMLHPGAWWIWALGMATAASRTTNPLLLALIIGVVSVVVSARRTEAPWAKGFGAYLRFGLLIVTIRVAFRIILGGDHGGHRLFTLPELPLPDAVAGISIGGPVTLEGVLSALYDGLRLATLIVCVGAANVLADAKRLLKAVPGALHEVGVAVTVALSIAPQLIESGQRIRRARRLRGEGGFRIRTFLAQVALPVMTDALDRSLLLASGMDARGYGRARAVPRHLRALTGALVLGGLSGVAVGCYGLLDSGTPPALGAPMLVGGLVLCAGGLVLGGRRVERTRYRPDPWRLPEWGVAATGVVVAGVVFAVSSVDPSRLNPSLQPLRWPALPPVATAAVLLGLLPAWIAPPVDGIGR